MPPKHVYARQRLVAGLFAGLLGHVVVAVVLGFFLAGGMSLSTRATATLIACVIATPAAFSVGFAFMLKSDSRSFGGGIAAGGLLSTILLTFGFFLA